MILENIDFTININYLILVILLILGIGYSYFIYRFTIPTTSTFVRTILILLRSTALFLIVLILFEPIITLNYLKKNEPINLLLLDNSSSIINKDSTTRSNKISDFIIDYKNNVGDKIKIATFGTEVKSLNLSENGAINFSDRTTNFEKIAPYIQKQKEVIATITILSDGIITDGSNSTTALEKLNIPIFTIAIGDTTKPSDIGIKKVEFNKLIYRDNETEINGIISNSNFGNKSITVSLFEQSTLVEQKQIKLNESGINNVNFTYKPKEIGKQNLTLKVSQIAKEDTYENNKYPFVIDVLNDKTNVLIIAGAPSADLSILNQSLVSSDKIKLNKIVQIAQNKFLESNLYSTKIDSADVIFMIDFPTSKTPTSLLKSVTDDIKSKKIPYFLILSEQTDYNKLNNFKDLLSFSIKSISYDYSLVQAKIISDGNGILKDLSSWKDLPPIKMNNTRIEAKSGASLLATSSTKVGEKEAPLLFTQKVASSRKIVFNGFGFWKWQLQSKNNLENTFNTFLNNSIKWLSTKKEQRIFVGTTKDIFNANESVEFVGNVYDETLTPVNDALVEVEIISDNVKKKIKLQSSKNGIYSGKIDISKPGSYSYKAIINSKNNGSKIVKGKFLISDIEVENISFVLNSNYLKFISNNTSGKSFNIDNYSDLFPKINQLSKIQTKNEVISTKFNVWRNELILLLIILLFAIEWIIRRQKGML